MLPSVSSVTFDYYTGPTSSRNTRRHAPRHNATNATHTHLQASEKKDAKKAIQRVDCPRRCGTILRNDNVRRHISSSCPNATRRQSLVCVCGRRLSRKDALTRHQATCVVHTSTTAVALSDPPPPVPVTPTLPDPTTNITPIEDSPPSLQEQGSHPFAGDTDISPSPTPYIHTSLAQEVWELLQEVTELSPPTPWLPELPIPPANLLPHHDTVWHLGTSMTDPRRHWASDEISLFGGLIDYPSHCQLFAEQVVRDRLSCLESTPMESRDYCFMSPEQGFAMSRSDALLDLGMDETPRHFDLYTFPA